MTENELEPGTLLANRYLIEYSLGVGGMGSVYFARDRSKGDSPVAVKEMRVLATNPRIYRQAIEQFAQEARFLANLDHPGLVKAHDLFEEGGRYFMVMNYISGKTIAEMLAQRKEPFELDSIIGWLNQLMDILEFLHKQNPPILYRDMKPGNIMIDRNDRVHLIDFGIAHCLHMGSETATFLQGIGSPDYCPLEQYHGAGGTDERSDIYSLGATLYHLLSGQPPQKASELALDHRGPISLRHINPKVPLQLDLFVVKAMALRKEQRFANIADMRTQLQKMRSRSEGAPTSEPSMQPRPSKKKGASKDLLMLSGLTLVVLVLLVWLSVQMTSH